jgi:ribosomal protein S18 acetylase RimI-like enzyme
VKVEVVDARDHRLEEYENYFRGYKALQLMDGAGRMRGELVWRLATGHTVEITEFGIYDPKDRRQGWGTLLLGAGLKAMMEFFEEIGATLRRVYAFCDSTNEAGRAFYRARGFRQEAELEGFYSYCNAILYVWRLKPMEEDEPGGTVEGS